MDPRSCFRPLILGIVAMVLGGSAFSAEASAGLESAYTHHDFAKCVEQPSPEPGVIEVRKCQGIDGMPVIWTGEPDASSVDFGATNSRESVDLGSFFEAEAVIEWRGSKIAGKLKPLAAIVRYRTGPSVGRLNSTRLLVYRVMSGRPSCIMAIVAGAGANEAARGIVDREVQRFVCGTSKRLVRVQLPRASSANLRRLKTFEPPVREVI